MSTWGDRLGVFDLETTGVDVDTSRIVSACIAVLDEDGGVVSRWNWLADPGIDIPDGASAVHGITTESAQEHGRPAQLVVAEIVQTLRVLFDSGIPVTVYNAPYDLSLLDRECRRHGLEPLDALSPVIDPLVIDKAVDRYRKGKRTLEVTAALYEVPLDDAHDAGADAIAAGRVALALLRRYPDELDISLADLQGRQEVWHAEQAASFQEYLRAKRGDDSYVADPSWPLKPAVDTSSFVDTQPIPPLPPRRGNVPILDFSATGVLALETSRGELTPEPRRRLPDPTPVAPIEDPFLDITDDEEPAWIVEPSEIPLVTVEPSGLGGSVSSGSLTVGELVESFPVRERDLPDTQDTDVVSSVAYDLGAPPESDDSDSAPDDSVPGDSVQDDVVPTDVGANESGAYDFAPDDSAPDDSGAYDLDVSTSGSSVWVLDDPAPPTAEEPASGDGDGEELKPSELGPDSEPMAANDAVGEPGSEATTEPESDPGPPQAVLRIAAAIVTDAGGRCLLVRKAGSSIFMQAGGKLEPGESALDALSRELQEELALDLDESAAEYLGVFRAEAANEPHTLVSAAVFALETTAELQAHGEIEELLWIDDLDAVQVELAPLTRDELLPLWASRRAGATLF